MFLQCTVPDPLMRSVSPRSSDALLALVVLNYQLKWWLIDSAVIMRQRGKWGGCQEEHVFSPKGTTSSSGAVPSAKKTAKQLQYLNWNLSFIYFFLNCK